MVLHFRSQTRSWQISSCHFFVGLAGSDTNLFGYPDVFVQSLFAIMLAVCTERLQNTKLLVSIVLWQESRWAQGIYWCFWGGSAAVWRILATLSWQALWRLSLAACPRSNGFLTQWIVKKYMHKESESVLPWTSRHFEQTTWLLVWSNWWVVHEQI